MLMPLALYPAQLHTAIPTSSAAFHLPMPTSELWQRLRQARKYADLTQADLAKHCGVTRGAVALWEAAEPENRTKPTTDHLIVISKTTGAPLEWLLNDAADINALWKLTGEFGGVTPTAVVAEPPRVEPDVLPDLRQGEHLFVFASTPNQIAAKLAALAAEPAATKTHLVLVGVAASVHAVSSPADALSLVVQTLTRA
jgi:transcriptional regulator with XRE-family HTH domain